MQLYIELAQGSVRNRNFVIKEQHLKNYLIKAREKKEELYQSYYYYDEEIIEHLKIRKTVRGYRGKYHLPHLIFDIDKMTNTDEFTLQRARVFLERLQDDFKVDPENVRVWFSGRGYHITTDNIFRFESSNYLPDEWKATAMKYFPEVDTLPYMTTGLIRVGYSINEKVGRYKIPLSVAELFQMNADDIIMLSKSNEFRLIRPAELRTDLDYSNLIIRTKESLRKEEKIVKTEEPTSIVTCMQKLYNRGAVEGRRHTDMLALTSAYKRKGLPLQATMLLMKDWAKGLENYEIEKNVKDVYNPEKDYRFSCQHPIMKEFCSPKCIHYDKKDYEIQTVSATQAEKNYVNYIRNFSLDRAFNLRDIFPIPNDFFFMPGEYVIMIGDTKIGKSALAQFLSVKLPKHKINYYSTEVPEELMFRRFIQSAHGITKFEVMDYYNQNTNTFSEKIKHISIITTTPRLDDLKAHIAESGADIIILDTIDGLSVGKLGEYTSREEKLAHTIRRICQELKVIIIAIHHIPKSQAIDDKGKPKPLNIHSGKGASALEQKADKIIGFEGKQFESSRTITSLGVRDETPFKMQVKYDYETFQFTKIMDLPLS
jgi:hypothetical protein